MAAVRNLAFSKLGNMDCQYNSEGQYASLCQILCRLVKPLLRYGNFFIKTAAVRGLNLLYMCLDHPRRVPGGLCHCATFGWNWYSSFDNIQVIFFCMLGLKIPTHAPELEVLGNLATKGTSLHDALIVKIRSRMWAELVPENKVKKKQEAPLFSTYLCDDLYQLKC